MRDYDLWVDFMRMRDDGRLRTRMRHAREGFVPLVGTYVVVGAEDSEPAVAQVLSVDIEGTIELRVLAGRVEEHVALLPG